MKIALALSLALNLAVAGVIGGALLGRERRGDAREEGRPSLSMLGLGPFALALPREGREELRGRVGVEAEALRDERRALGEALRAVQAALRAEPFDRAAAEAALGASRDGVARVQALGHAALLDQMAAMSAAERAALAERLDRMLRRAGGRR